MGKRIELSREDIVRFWGKVEKEGDDACWLWKGATRRKGYGVLVVKHSQNYVASRVAWTPLKGEIPSGMLVCHNCPTGDNPRCCNPTHMFLGSHKDNHADSKRKGRRATGERHGSRTRPERTQRGDDHWTRRRPELVKRGEDSPSRLHPERMARGEAAHKSSITEEDVVRMRTEYASGSITLQKLALRHSVTPQAIWRILKRLAWKHVP